MNEVGNFCIATQGDTLSQLYTEYYSKIYKYILYRVGDPNIAEDLVSEVFEKMLVKYCTYNSQKAKFNTWLYTIANNTIINFHKINRNHCPMVNLEKIESKYRMEDSIIEQELKELVVKAMMCLDERQRTVIALKFAACLTNRQIAQMLNLTESNVGTILYRSLKRLRDILKEQGAVYEPESNLRCNK